jgi:Rare lipoprotein B
MKRRAFLAACALAVSAAGLVSGCGFQLRRLEGIPFASMYIDAPAVSQVGTAIRKALQSGKYVQLVAKAPDAAVVLRLSDEKSTKTILSLTGGGRVSEYRLGFRLTYSATGKDGHEWIPPYTVELTRDMTYDDSALLAKGAEETLLYRDMQDDAAQQILRRLRSLKPAQQSDELGKPAQPVVVPAAVVPAAVEPQAEKP